MNTNILKYLVELAGGEVNPVNVNTFFDRYPREGSTDELHLLAKAGFITLTNADNQITGIAVNKKAVTYLKNTAF